MDSNIATRRFRHRTRQNPSKRGIISDPEHYRKYKLFPPASTPGHLFPHSMGKQHQRAFSTTPVRTGAPFVLFYQLLCTLINGKHESFSTLLSIRFLQSVHGKNRRFLLYLPRPYYFQLNCPRISLNSGRENFLPRLFLRPDLLLLAPIFWYSRFRRIKCVHGSPTNVVRTRGRKLFPGELISFIERRKEWRILVPFYPRRKDFFSLHFLPFFLLFFFRPPPPPHSSRLPICPALSHRSPFLPRTFSYSFNPFRSLTDV